MSTLKWSNGSHYQQSKRRAPSSMHQNSRANSNSVDDFFNAELLTPMARALANDETWTVDDSGTFYPTIPYSFAQDDFKPSSKREETYNKMAERDMVGQTSRNPFIETSQNYADDISSPFLTPVSTSQDKVHAGQELAYNS
jgi:hypothetical protein